MNALEHSAYNVERGSGSEGGTGDRETVRRLSSLQGVRTAKTGKWQ